MEKQRRRQRHIDRRRRQQQNGSSSRATNLKLSHEQRTNSAVSSPAHKTAKRVFFVFVTCGLGESLNSNNNTSYTYLFIKLNLFANCDTYLLKFLLTHTRTHTYICTYSYTHAGRQTALSERIEISQTFSSLLLA